METRDKRLMFTFKWLYAVPMKDQNEKRRCEWELLQNSGVGPAGPTVTGLRFCRPSQNVFLLITPLPSPIVATQSSAVFLSTGQSI
jgi:hypothetical protein